MPEPEPDDQPNLSENEDASKSDRERRSRPRTLTAEQRRLLGTPRPLHARQEVEKEIVDEPAPADLPAEPAVQQRRETRAPVPKIRADKESTESQPEPEAEAKFEPESDEPALAPGPQSALRKRDEKSSRAIEMQHAAIIIGAIIVLCMTFYVGKKFDYWRYLLMTKNKAKLTEKVPDKYPGVSANELVEQALASERAGRPSEAAERLLAAKHKNLRYRGILFRVGKMAYDHGNFDTADRLLERAIAFGENVEVANYLRGLIATRRRDLPAAERFFEAATVAEPFVADYYYYWAEALRFDQRPRDAIARYEQAARRARDDQDVTVCQFKVRMARMEGGEISQLKDEIAEKGSAGPLPLDWLMTDAGVAIREGRIEDAVRSLTAARASSAHTENGGGIFVSCKGDAIFQDACKKFPELADACEVKATSP